MPARNARKLSVTVTTEIAQPLPENINRGFLYLQNRGGTPIFVEFDGVPDPVSSLSLDPLGVLILDGIYVPSNPLQVRTGAGSALLLIIEG